MPPALARRIIPSLVDLMFIATLLLVLWLGSFISSRDGDLGWHIALGRVILETGTVPTSDFLSHTMQGRPFVPHEWLAEVIFAALYGVGGFDAVALLTASAIALTFAGLLAVMLCRGVSPLVAGPLVGLGMLASIVHWAARPHIFTFLFTLVWATTLEEHRRREEGGGLRLIWLLPVMLLWVNLHGAFLIGYELTGTYLAGALLQTVASGGRERARHLRQARDLGLLLSASLLISAANPVGFDLLRYSVDFVSQGYLRDLIPELQSPDFHNPLFLPFLLLLAITLAVSVRRELTPMLLLASWGAFALISFRNVPQFIIICLPLIAESAQDTIRLGVARAIAPEAAAPLRGVVGALVRRGERFTTQVRAVSGGIPAVVALLVIAALMGRGVRMDLWQQGHGFSPTSFPVSAVEQLRPFPPGQRVFNDAAWGGYLSFCCWPRVTNFVDGRVDFYGEAYMRAYYSALDAEPGWQEVLDRHRIDWVLVYPDRPIAQWLAQDPAWERIYADATAVVFVRR
jgi:hypothetical protein